MSRHVKTYWLRIMGPNERMPEDADAREAADTAARAVSEAEENISDLLPEGYYCKIDEVRT